MSAILPQWYFRDVDIEASADNKRILTLYKIVLRFS